MKNFCRHFFLVFAFTASSSALSEEVPSECHGFVGPKYEDLPTLVSKGQPDRGALWTVSKNGHQSYIYGTIHVAKIEWMVPGPRVGHALHQSSHLAVEIDVFSQGKLKIIRNGQQANVQQSALTPARELLRERIGRNFKKLCLDESKYRHIPIAARSSILTMYAASAVGLLPDYAVDFTVIGYAKNTGKPLINIETLREQVRFPNQTSSAVRSDLDALESGETARIVTRIAKDWSEGDLDDIQALVDACMCVPGWTNADTLNLSGPTRNKQMADRLASYFIDDKKVFAAVGIFHTVGPDSVIVHLQEKGFVVKRVDFSPSR